MSAILKKVLRSLTLGMLIIDLVALGLLFLVGGGPLPLFVSLFLPATGIAMSVGFGLDIAGWSHKPAAAAGAAFAVCAAVGISAVSSALSRKSPTFDYADDFLGLLFVPVYFGAVMVTRYQSRRDALKAANGAAEPE